MATTGEILRMTLTYSQPGASMAQNVFYWLLGNSADDESVRNALEVWVRDNWGAEWEEFASEGAELLTMALVAVNTGGLVTRDLGGVLINIVGDVASAVTSAAVAASIYGATDRPKTRGRKFIPGITEATIIDGLLSAVQLGDLAVMLGHYISPFSEDGINFTPGVISTVTNEFLPFSGSGGFDDIPDYQRRRRPDRGS